MELQAFTSFMTEYHEFTRHENVVRIASEVLPLPIVIISIIAAYSISDVPDELLQYLFETQPKNELKIEIDLMTMATITWGPTPTDFRQKRYRISVLFKQTGAIVHGARIPFTRIIKDFWGRSLYDFNIWMERFPMIPAGVKHWHIGARQAHRVKSAEIFYMRLMNILDNV